MSRNRSLLILIVLLQYGCSHWTDQTEGVKYQRFKTPTIEAHVTRIDLRNPANRIVVSDESMRGTTVSELANQYQTIVAVNGDYFDEDHHPVGHSVGHCGPWYSVGSARRQWVVGFADDRAEILHPESLEAPLPGWVDYAVSGWPLLIEGCEVLTATELPGSDSFTRAPHPRTAVGISADERYVFLVVVDGRREGVPGVTLEALGSFMRNELGACSALNLDGGGSTEMVLDGVIVNQPSDGHERPVGNHVAVVPRSFEPECNGTQP